MGMGHHDGEGACGCGGSPAGGGDDRDGRDGTEQAQDLTRHPRGAREDRASGSLHAQAGRCDRAAQDRHSGSDAAGLCEAERAQAVHAQRTAASLAARHAAAAQRGHGSDADRAVERRSHVAVRDAAFRSETGRLRAHEASGRQAALVMRRVAIALSLALAACGGGGSKEPEKPKAEPVSERKAEKDAKGLVTEIYATIGRANTDGLMALVADPVYVLGPRKKDALATRADALVSLKEILEAEKAKKFPVHSGNLSVVASPGGLSAWVVDTIEVEGSPMAVTAVLTNADDFWVVSAASVAVTPSMKSVRSELKKDAVVPPAMELPGKVPDAAEGAAEKFKKGFAHPVRWGED